MSSPPRALGGIGEIVTAYDGFCVDQFGVMHDGQQPYPGAVDALRRLTGSGKAVVIVTNSGKRSAPNIARVVAMGFPRDSFTDLVSSGEVAWDGLLTGRFGKPFLAGARLGVIGRSGDDYGLEDLDIAFTDRWAEADGLLIMGSDCPRVGLDRYRTALAPAARAHVPALCCNPDVAMLTPDGLQPAPGAIAALYAELGGPVRFIGKPHPAIFHQAGRYAGVEGHRMLMVGDSLDHDIAGGAGAGLATALVRTGVHAGLTDAAFQALLGAAAHRPDVILPSLRW